MPPSFIIYVYWPVPCSGRISRLEAWTGWGRMLTLTTLIRWTMTVASSMSDGAMPQYIQLRLVWCCERTRSISLMKSPITTSHLHIAQRASRHGSTWSATATLVTTLTGRDTHVSAASMFENSLANPDALGTSRYFQINNMERPEGYEDETWLSGLVWRAFLILTVLATIVLVVFRNARTRIAQWARAFIHQCSQRRNMIWRWNASKVYYFHQYWTISHPMP